MKFKTLSEMETFFTALADKTRLRLLNLMRADEVCVLFFTKVLVESQPKISRHLAYLRKAGVVKTRRAGKWMFYRIISPQNDYIAQVLEDTLVWLSLQKEMNDDYRKLLEIYSSKETSNKKFQTIETNILPQTYISYDQEEMETFLL